MSDKDKALTLEQTAKKVKALRKKLIETEKNLEDLSNKVSTIESRQDTMMYNLRRVMKHLNLEVQKPDSKS